MRLLIFDLDGTLLNSMPSFARLAAWLMSGVYDISQVEAEKSYWLTTGSPFREQLEILFPDHSRNSEVAEKYEELKADVFLNLPLFPRTRETLIVLREQNFLLGLCSSTVKTLVDGVALQEHLPFDHLGGLYNGNDKAEQMLTCLKDLGVRKEEALFIGDSDSDAFYAAKAGICFIKLHLGISPLLQLVGDVERS